MYTITTCTVPEYPENPAAQEKQVIQEEHKTRHINLAFRIAKAFCEEPCADNANITDHTGWLLFECKRDNEEVIILLGEDIR